LVSQNDVTGDRLISNVPTKLYKEQYELIYKDKYIDSSPLARAINREANMETPSYELDSAQEIGGGC